MSSIVINIDAQQFDGAIVACDLERIVLSITLIDALPDVLSRMYPYIISPESEHINWSVPLRAIYMPSRL